MQRVKFTTVRSAFALTILFAVFAVWTGGCGTEPILTDPAVEEDPAFSPDQAPEVMTPEPIQTTVGKTFTISLESNPTTGYMWEPEFDTEALKLVDRDFVSDSTMIGSPGTETLTFEALKPGETRVNLLYKRSWEGGHIDEQSRTVRIAPADAEDMTKNQKVGATFTISLESNPTTGYSWQPEYDSELLDLIDSEFTPDSTLIGAPGVETFKFKALKQGETKVTMTYKRPWEEVHLDKQIIPVTIVP